MKAQSISNRSPKSPKDWPGSTNNFADIHQTIHPVLVAKSWMLVAVDPAGLT
jgi:hypothetical protein